MTFTTIRKRRDFVVATETAKKFIVNSLILQRVKRSDDHPVGTELVRIGFTVTKKMGNAVTRNRIKRRLREAARPLLPKLGQPGFDYVLIPRHSALTCDFSQLSRDMEFAFSQIIHHKGHEFTRSASPRKKKT